MVLAKSTQARLRHFPALCAGILDDAAGFTARDLGVSRDRASTGWLTSACARLRHDRSFALEHPGELLDARGWKAKVVTEQGT